MWPVQAQRGCWQGQDWRMRVGHRVCQVFGRRVSKALDMYQRLVVRAAWGR